MIVRLGNNIIIAIPLCSGGHLYGFPAPGSLLNTNTIDSFKEADKKKLLEETATKVHTLVLVVLWNVWSNLT